MVARLSFCKLGNGSSTLAQETRETRASCHAEVTTVGKSLFAQFQRILLEPASVLSIMAAP